MSNLTSRRAWIVPVAIGVWLIAAIGAAAWHYGPGQRYAALSASAEAEALATTAAAREDWNEAVRQYTAALAALPPEDQAERDRLTLAFASARIQIGELAEAQEQLADLQARLEQNQEREGGAKPETAKLLEVVRHESATAAYFAAWLMRLEGAAPEEWKVETEQSRQQFHLLAEEASSAGDDEQSLLFRKNLEAAIKLEQMDESALLGRPLPKKCPNCCKNLSQRKRKQSQSKCESEGDGKPKEKQPQDARKDVKQSRGAGLNDGSIRGS